MTDQEQDVATDGQGQAAPPKKKKRFSRRAKVTVGIVAVMVICLGAGFYSWHETPGFCAAFCHNMDPYLETYQSDPESSATDKYGNEVEDASAMLSSVHRQYGNVTCLQCHGAVLSDQVSMGIEWITGSYDDPILEHSTTWLPAAAAGDTEDSFCLNEACHNMTRTDLQNATANYGEINPHSTEHGEYQCSDCHKSHRASVMVCSQCHDGEIATAIEVPDGWLTYDESVALMEKVPNQG